MLLPIPAAPTLITNTGLSRREGWMNLSIDCKMTDTPKAIKNAIGVHLGET